jgi:SEC-C motif domain protein
MTQVQDCPCGAKDAKGRALAFEVCCGRWIAREEFAPTAQALMRSRYSAYVLEDAAYLLSTWHASTRPASLDFEVGAKWLGLEVRSAWEVDATHAEVEFVARYRVQGRAVRMHERSRFVQENGRWFYVDGDWR